MHQTVGITCLLVCAPGHVAGWHVQVLPSGAACPTPSPPAHLPYTPPPRLLCSACTLRQRRASSAACYPAPCVSRAAYDPAHDHTTHAHTPTCPFPFPAPALQDGLLFPDQELALHPG